MKTLRFLIFSLDYHYIGNLYLREHIICCYFHSYALIFCVLQVAEYFVGDGPNNRYALICKQCAGHNGMALAEEFEFIG